MLESTKSSGKNKIKRNYSSQNFLCTDQFSEFDRLLRAYDVDGEQVSERKRFRQLMQGHLEVNR